MERNEAIEVVKRNYPHVTESGSQFETALRTLIPELRESEDERIRKWCISHFRECFRVTTNNAEYKEYLNNKVIPWLEKQGEQNLANSAKTCKDVEQKLAWSEEDEEMSRFIGNAITTDDSSVYLKSKGIEVIDAHVWLYELKDRVQPKQEWGEEDENHIQHISDFIMRNRVGDTDAIYRLEQDVNWLLSLKERYTWKPSDEQMKALNDINLTGGVSYAGQGQELVNLYQDLKKLREE